MVEHREMPLMTPSTHKTGTRTRVEVWDYISYSAKRSTHLLDPKTTKYLFWKLWEKLILQLLQMRDLAALTEEAVSEALQEWLQLDLDEEPLMPLTYYTSPRKQQPSVYILDEG